MKTMIGMLVLLSWPALAATAEMEQPSARGQRVEGHPCLARYEFDETNGVAVIRESSGNSRLAVAAMAPRTRGVFGNALRLRGQHALAMRDFLPGRELGAITFSAWVRPAYFDRYNEIFRQECNERLLFSFQEHGAVLSLGLNIGGYIECDAPLKPEAALDGAWHHCAATFDGATMRCRGLAASPCSRARLVSLPPTAAPASICRGRWMNSGFMPPL
jgi:hypothetical protein